MGQVTKVLLSCNLVLWSNYSNGNKTAAPSWADSYTIKVIQEHAFIIVKCQMSSITSENHWQITSRVTKKLLFVVTSVLFYFLHAILCLEHHPAANNHRSLILPLTLRTVFSELTLWHHHSRSVTSCECEALWGHIRRLFLHAQIGAKAIFTSE